MGLEVQTKTASSSAWNRRSSFHRGIGCCREGCSADGSAAPAAVRVTSWNGCTTTGNGNGCSSSCSSPSLFSAEIFFQRGHQRVSPSAKFAFTSCFPFHSWTSTTLACSHCCCAPVDVGKTHTVLPISGCDGWRLRELRAEVLGALIEGCRSAAGSRS